MLNTLGAVSFGMLAASDRFSKRVRKYQRLVLFDIDDDYESFSESSDDDLREKID